METEGVPGRSRLKPGPRETDEQAAFGGGADVAEVWLLQAEAAELAGCSVSAIRKWRREGSVLSRKKATPGGMERVEVRLSDVMTRAGKRTVVAAPSPSLGGPVAAPPVAGTVLVSLADLQAMFARSATPERRSDDLQAHYRSLESEVSFMRGQMARLTARGQERPRADPQVEELERRVSRTEAETQRLGRQLEAVRKELEKLVVARRAGHRASQSGSETVTQPPHPVAPVTGDTGPQPEAPTFEGWLEGRTPPEKPSAPTGPPIERLAEELGRLYQILSTRPRTSLGPEERARWAAELRRYDTVLVRACSRLGVPTEHRPGDRLTAPDRVALTRALADAGLDVRRSPASVEG